jgi:hypothetical protein
MLIFTAHLLHTARALDVFYCAVKLWASSFISTRQRTPKLAPWNMGSEKGARLSLANQLDSRFHKVDGLKPNTVLNPMIRLITSSSIINWIIYRKDLKHLHKFHPRHSKWLFWTWICSLWYNCLHVRSLKGVEWHYTYCLQVHGGHCFDRCSKLWDWGECVLSFCQLMSFIFFVAKIRLHCLIN